MIVVQQPSLRRITAYLHPSLSLEEALDYFVRTWSGPGTAIHGCLRGIPLVYTGEEGVEEMRDAYKAMQAYYEACAQAEM